MGFMNRVANIISGGRVGESKERYEERKQSKELARSIAQRKGEEVKTPARTAKNLAKKFGKSIKEGSKVKRTRYGYSIGGITRSRRVGRPKGTYKYGVPISRYKKMRSAAKRRARVLSEKRDLDEQRYLAKRGISPEEAKQIVDRRQLSRIGYRRVQEVQEQAMGIPRVHGVPRIPEGYKVEEDLMTGRKRIIKLPEREKWTY
jgi:hypothetical protein